MTVRDFDILSPGNTTRHLVTTLSLCGTNKATLVKVVLDNRPYNRAVIVANPAPLASPAEAAELLDAYDLVVDATADGAVTSMLEDAARATGRRFITACLQNEGPHPTRGHRPSPTTPPPRTHPPCTNPQTASKCSRQAAASPSPAHHRTPSPKPQP
ncbi:hypothetical protein LP418_06750 [Nocardioides sp. B-3]|nr:hypothetical protein [Nocardioides sp. B-3]UUZ60561.1 hypothetical protein LP418_06750 [Nocardioides sp. B-3]